ncbi:Protein of unknown function (DUF2834) [Rivularia sp. PCC 7116]|uniref:DUF2834 domain-containing protein n=1 Tax=Rivularia sp. PCC 7116 TaxID=373994 RepID=UPI00029F0034|nr:DUF2834 domain-containing protein [Rivularia sp. PCC 7116]AFY54128.1 Protein of unknown function (DUF2834) [Rivularia sp. PCC 7116]
MSNTTYQNQTSASSKLFSAKSLYLLLVIIGSIAPWSLILEFFIQNGFSIELLIQKEFDNYAAAAFGTDLLISALVFLCFSFVELKRLGLSRSRLLIYIAATFGVGLSCSLPLFLYFREGVLESKNS